MAGQTPAGQATWGSGKTTTRTVGEPDTSTTHAHYNTRAPYSRRHTYHHRSADRAETELQTCWGENPRAALHKEGATTHRRDTVVHSWNTVPRSEKGPARITEPRQKSHETRLKRDRPPDAERPQQGRLLMHDTTRHSTCPRTRPLVSQQRNGPYKQRQ